MNKYIILSNSSDKSNKIIDKLISLFDDNWKLDLDNPEYVFIIGGDGTFLKNLDKINKFKDIFVILINGGNFGFYSHFNINNLQTILKQIKNKNKYFKPWLISTIIDNKEYMSINEALITSNKTTTLKIEINGTIYQKFIGTGIMFSTPTGSTGRNKSSGGAVIFPNIDVIQMIEVQPINQKNYRTLSSPIILNNDSKVKISIMSKNNDNHLILDGNIFLDIKNLDINIHFKKSNFYLFKPYDIKSYIKKLRKAYISGG